MFGANQSATDRPSDTAKTLTPIHADSANGNSEQPRFFARDSDGTGNAFDGFVADVTTIAQSQCEHTTDYADIESLVRDFPIDHLTFAAHDSSASYSGPYSMTLLVRAFIIKENTQIVQKQPTGWTLTVQDGVQQAHLENISVAMFAPERGIVIDPGPKTTITDLRIQTLGWTPTGWQRDALLYGDPTSAQNVTIDGEPASF